MVPIVRYNYYFSYDNATGSNIFRSIRLLIDQTGGNFEFHIFLCFVSIKRECVGISYVKNMKPGVETLSDAEVALRRKYKVLREKQALQVQIVLTSERVFRPEGWRRRTATIVV